MKQKLDKFEVVNPKVAMQNFKDALSKIVNVPKSAVDKKLKRVRGSKTKEKS